MCNIPKPLHWYVDFNKKIELSSFISFIPMTSYV